MKSAAELAEALMAANTDRLDDSRAKVCAILCILDREGKPLPDAFKEGFPFRVMRARALYYDIEFDDYAVAFLAYCGARNVAEAVMYTTVLQALYLKLKRRVTLTDVVDVFPYGFPVESETHRLWDAQKIPIETLRERRKVRMWASDNQIDYDGFWYQDHENVTEYKKHEDN